MTKRECIAYIKAQQKNVGILRNYDGMTKVYKQCETVCRQNGYVGECFIQLWNAATRETAIEGGVYRG